MMEPPEDEALTPSSVQKGYLWGKRIDACRRQGEAQIGRGDKLEGGNTMARCNALKAAEAMVLRNLVKCDTIT